MTTLNNQRIADEIAVATDMLGRLGQRDAYEVNYTSEKLCRALQACARALVECRHTPEGIGELAEKSASIAARARA